MNGESFAYARFVTAQKMHRGERPMRLCPVCFAQWCERNPR